MRSSASEGLLKEEVNDDVEIITSASDIEDEKDEEDFSSATGCSELHPIRNTVRKMTDRIRKILVGFQFFVTDFRCDGCYIFLHCHWPFCKGEVASGDKFNKSLKEFRC